ncbi:MAG: TIGR03435 family protein, partial [Limisphaerales bacterium]
KGTLKIMAWTKAKTAITAGVIILLAVGTTTIVVKRFGSPSVDESLWSVNSDNLAKAPPVLIIRPARYPNRVGSVGDGNKVIGLNMPISALFTRAYGFGAARMIFPTSFARQHYDLMLTLLSHETESLREKLKTQLGLIARREIVETNALCLKVVNTARLKSCVSKGGSPMGYMTSDISFARLIVTNEPASVLAAQLEGLLQIPTVDQTGTTENFDINLKWSRNDPRHDSLKNALLNQPGLELVPTNMPIEMLVVEKAN